MSVWKNAESEVTGGTSQRCYMSHPALTLGKGIVYGGSASWPAPHKADIYVSLQSGSTSGRISDPWDPHVVIEIQYQISDGKAPVNVPRFKKLITYLCNQLHEGKTIHVGCIGGHGRTGLVLSALVAKMLKEKNAIQYVRQHYCDRAVESPAQVKFLMDHYHVSKTKPSRAPVPKAPIGFLTTGGGSHYSASSLGSHSPAYGDWRTFPTTVTVDSPRPVVPEGVTEDTKKFAPLESSRCLWRARK